jgi:hypothetical protein
VHDALFCVAQEFLCMVVELWHCRLVKLKDVEDSRSPYI